MTPATAPSSSNATRLRRERTAEKKAAAEIVAETPGLSDTLLHPPIDSIQASPNNPRKRFDQDALDELADSIRENGVLQPILVRVDRSAAGYEIVSGERRWRAAKMAGLQYMPAVLLEAGGEQAARVARIVENVQRQDLSPMELADSLADLLELGLTQTQAGKRVGMSQSRVAHVLKLRELPAEVRQVLEGGQLSAAHGEALSKWAAFPAFAAVVARVGAERGWSARRIADPDFDEIDEAEENRAENEPSLFERLSYDVIQRANCAECPFGAFVHQDTDYGREDWCLKPSHRAEIQEQMRQERMAPRPAPDTSALVEAARAAAHAPVQAYVTVAGVAKPVPAPMPELEVGDRVRHSAFGDGSVLEAKPHAVLIKPDDGGKDFWTGLNAFGGGKIVLLDEHGDASAHTPEVAPAPKIPTLSDLGYGNYEPVTARSPAACRNRECPCLGKARGWNGGDLVEICTEPGRYRSLLSQETKARNAENKRRHVEAFSKLEDFVRDAVGIGVREMVVISQAIANDDRGYRPAEGRFPQAWADAKHWLNGSGDQVLDDRSALKSRLDKLAVLGSAVPLTKALVEAICRQDLAMRFSPEGGASYGALADWYVGGGLPKRTPDDWQPEAETKKARAKA